MMLRPGANSALEEHQGCHHIMIKFRFRNGKKL